MRRFDMVMPEYLYKRIKLMAEFFKVPMSKMFIDLLEIGYIYKHGYETKGHTATKICRDLEGRKMKDIAIAIMNIEHNRNRELTDELYEKFSKKYDDYFENHDDLTGILNEVLQKK